MKNQPQGSGHRKASMTIVRTSSSPNVLIGGPNPDSSGLPLKDAVNDGFPNAGLFDAAKVAIKRIAFEPVRALESIGADYELEPDKRTSVPNGLQQCVNRNRHRSAPA